MAEAKLVLKSEDATDEQLKELAEWFKEILDGQISGGNYEFSITVE